MRDFQIIWQTIAEAYRGADSFDRIGYQLKIAALAIHALLIVMVLGSLYVDIAELARTNGVNSLVAPASAALTLLLLYAGAAYFARLAVRYS